MRYWMCLEKTQEESCLKQWNWSSFCLCFKDWCCVGKDWGITVCLVLITFWILAHSMNQVHVWSLMQYCLCWQSLSQLKTRALSFFQRWWLLKEMAFMSHPVSGYELWLSGSVIYVVIEHEDVSDHHGEPDYHRPLLYELFHVLLRSLACSWRVQRGCIQYFKWLPDAH